MSSCDPFQNFSREDFFLDGRKATLVHPLHPAPGNRWVWRAEFFGAFPAFDQAMLQKGWSVGYVNVGNTFGCPSAMRRFDAFYKEMTGARGFHPKPVLEGLSRGGLYVYNWASAHPDCVGLIYADNPVCDFKSWPGGKGAGPGSPQDWKELLACYGFRTEEEAMRWSSNPVDNLAPLLKASIPIVHWFGDADEVVPWEENTGVMADLASAAGSEITLFRKPGGLHHPHGPTDPKGFADWVIERALE